MKKHARFIGAFVLLVLVASVYRIIPGRPGGFAPQMAMAVFGGSVFIKNKKWAFLLPIGSLSLSDLLYEAFYKMGLSATPGFYQGQLLNYIIFASITFFGFLLKKDRCYRLPAFRYWRQRISFWCLIFRYGQRVIFMRIRLPV